MTAKAETCFQNAFMADSLEKMAMLEISEYIRLRHTQFNARKMGVKPSIISNAFLIKALIPIGFPTRSPTPPEIPRLHSAGVLSPPD